MIRKLLLVLLVFQFSACAELQKLAENAGGSALSNADIANGLKEALNIGIGKGSDLLSRTDGYYKSAYKILLPEEARQITEKLKFIPGFADVEEVLIQKLNRAAEDAATRAKPIFVQAIRDMTFDDALKILMGPDDSATSYLNKATYQNLYTAFNPVIMESLNKFNAIEYWEQAVTAYNKIPFVQKANPRLDDYVTTRALDGLFDMVKKEELVIRHDISKRTSDLLKRVFARQDGNRNQQS